MESDVKVTMLTGVFVCEGPACWLWDYLRMSRALGCMLPVSVDVDSDAVYTENIVWQCQEGDSQDNMLTQACFQGPHVGCGTI